MKPSSSFHSRVILIPLDDRPCCLQFVQRLAALRHIEVLTPPRHLLGNLRHAGHCLALWQWLDRQPKDVPALISVDMMMFGGLVNSRQCSCAHWENSESWRRMQTLCKRPHTYLFSTITRLAPTQFHASEAAHHARVVEDLVVLGKTFVDNDSLTAAVAAGELAKLHSQLHLHTPAPELNEILSRRSEKFNMHKRLLELIENSNADNYLLLGLDDSKTHGVNILESKALQALCAHNPKAMVTTGADELAQLLLVRLFAPQQNLEIIWSNEKWRDQVTRYEDCPLREVIQRQLAVANARRNANESETAKKVLCIWCPSLPQQTEAATQDYENIFAQLVAIPRHYKAHRSVMPANNHNSATEAPSVRTQYTSLSQHALKNNVSKQRDSEQQENQRKSEQCRTFVRRIANLISEGYQVSLADLAYANGCDAMLSDMLLKEGVFFRLSGFAGWNTAANASGTALASLLLTSATSTNDEKMALQRLLTERLIDDMLYQSILRQRIASLRNGTPHTQRNITHWNDLERKITAWAESCLECLLHSQKQHQGLSEASSSPKLAPISVKLSFPWHRFFEIEANVVWRDEVEPSEKKRTTKKKHLEYRKRKR